MKSIFTTSTKNQAKFIKVGYLRWIGHVERMQNNKIPKHLLRGKPDGRRPPGVLNSGDSIESKKALRQLE